MARGGRYRREDRVGPLRTCVVTRRRLPRSSLLRLVADADGQVRVDLPGRAPGRGGWVLPEAEALRRLEGEPRRLGRALRRGGLTCDGLLEQAREQARQRSIHELRLAWRSGVLSAVPPSEDQLWAWIVTADGRPAPTPVGEVLRCDLTASELGSVLARGPMSLLAVQRSRPGRRLARWLRWRGPLGYDRMSLESRVSCALEWPSGPTEVEG